MVIVDIYGGLGNQMFQYAVGRHLSKKLNTKLKFDYSFNLIRTDFDPKDITKIFDIFNVIGEKATIQEIEKFKAPRNKISVKKYYFYIKNKYPSFFRTKYNLIKESYYHFNKDILSLSSHCYLSGYWQSEQYFSDIENLIREDFRIKKPMFGNNLEIAEKIKKTESVSVHLRGRDYITRKEINKKHLTCDNSYYERSLSLIREKIKNPQFFVFSDDPEWAKYFLKTNYSCTFVEGNSWNKTNYEDLRLMSLCKNNIIANSSFSWWGAWLNQNPNKIIIGPKKWFNDPGRKDDNPIPDSWIKI